MLSLSWVTYDMVYACLAIKPGDCYLNLSVSLLVIQWEFSVSLPTDFLGTFCWFVRFCE